MIADLHVNDKVTIEVLRGVGGLALLVEDRRVAGPKALGGGDVVVTFRVSARAILRAMGIERP